MTNADQIASRFGNDGAQFLDTSGTDLSDVCAEEASRFYYEGATEMYIFPDKSALGVFGDSWYTNTQHDNCPDIIGAFRCYGVEAAA